jgi:hypothetical protein
MRFKKGPKLILKERFIKRFLWWPLKIENETRWLENAIYKEVLVVAAGTHFYEKVCWIDPCSDCGGSGFVYDGNVDSSFICSTCHGKGYEGENHARQK